MGTPLQIRRVQPIGQPMGDAIVLPYQRSRLLLMAVLSVAMGLLGLLMLLVGDGGGRLIGALALVFFGGGAAVLATMAAQPGMIAFTRHGLSGESRWARAFVPWSAVTGVGESWIGTNRMVVVDVDDPTHVVTSRGIGWLKGLNARAGLPDLAFPTNLLGSSTPVLVTAVKRYATDPEARGRIGTAKDLAALLERAGAEPASSSGTASPTAAAPVVAGVLLWVVGGAGLLLALLGLLGDPAPGREESRALGTALIGGGGGLALVAAWLLGHRPRAGRLLGIAAAVVAGFIGGVVTQGERNGMAGLVVGGLVILAAATIAWQLWRWRPDVS